METSNGFLGWGAGPISVLKDLKARAQSQADDSPGTQSSSSDEGLTMSIQRQQGKIPLLCLASQATNLYVPI